MEDKVQHQKQRLRVQKLSRILLGNFVLLSTSLFADNSILKLTTEETVKRALENNYNLQNLRYELAKSDTNFLKNDSKYSWRLVADGRSSQSILPFNQTNIFTGTKISDDTIKGGIEKILQTTGTYFKMEAGTRRFDSNAFENPATTPAGFSALGIPPLYTGFVRATISQDLLKNSFGYKGRNEIKILESQAEIAKNQVSQQISAVIVESLVDFWDYSIKTQAVKTYKQLVENTKNIRNLTIRKQSLGLSESFEVNQWKRPSRSSGKPIGNRPSSKGGSETETRTFSQNSGRNLPFRRDQSFGGTDRKTGLHKRFRICL